MKTGQMTKEFEKVGLKNINRVLSTWHERRNQRKNREMCF